MSVTGDLFIQVGCYAGLMIFTIFGMATLFRGFFWKYIKVRTSFGKNVLVKIRTPLRDFYAVGWVEENFLCYKFQDFIIRIAINTQDKIFYRSMAINWIDVDEEKNAVCKVDYSAVAGFDAKKHSDLLTRALMRPTISSGKEKIILVCVILTLILAGAAAYLSYNSYAVTQTLSKDISGLVSTAVTNAMSSKGTVVAASTLV